MTETRLQSKTNSGTWIFILAPTYSMKNFISRTTMSTYIIPFVIGMLLARDSIVGILIPSSISLPASLFTRSVMHHPVTNSLVTLLARLIVMCITECRCQNRWISGRGSRTVRLGSMVTGDGGHDVYPGSGPLYGGNTLLPT